MNLVGPNMGEGGFKSLKSKSIILRFVKSMRELGVREGIHLCVNVSVVDGEILKLQQIFIKN